MSRDKSESMGAPLEESFLDRWSRLKRADPAIDAPDATSTAPASEVDEAPTAEHEAENEEQVLERLGLKNPDQMEAGDDFSGFMRAGVPAYLKRKALRKLWLTNPVLANLDELLEYGEDFTDAATVVANLQTSYQVGRGMLAQFDNEEEDDVEEGLDDTDSPDERIEDVDEATVTAQPSDETTTAQSEENSNNINEFNEFSGDRDVEQAAVDHATYGAIQDELEPPRRKSMRFQFG